MTRKNTSTWLVSKELIFQLALHIVVFLFYSFDKKQPYFQEHEFAFFLSYTIAALVINYVLLPKYYYQKKYLPFFTLLLLTIGALIITEELILEPIYFPGRRANTFPGLFFTLVHIMPVITILSGFKFAWDALGKQREVEELKAAVKESELQFLKTQINPHFLFNNLNNLYAHAMENSPKTPEIILELAGVLRYMLYECKDDFVSLSKEIAQLGNFINLSELQIEERGTVKFSTHNIKAPYQIAPLILIVFIENAFKHSTASQSEDIAIEVEAKLSEGGVLDFWCKNSFRVLSNTDNLSQGIGLENVIKRLELIYPDAHQLHIENRDNFYEVYLSIELTKSTET